MIRTINGTQYKVKNDRCAALVEGKGSKRSHQCKNAARPNSWFCKIHSHGGYIPWYRGK